MAASQTALFLQSVGNQAYRQGEIGSIGGVATYMSQNVPTFVGPGNLDAPATVTGAQSTTWAAAMNTEAMPGTMSLVTGAWTGTTVKAGTVFTIGTAGTAVKAVNPVTKAVLPFQQMFTVLADATVSGGAATLTITPPIIPIGSDQAFGTVDQGAQAGATIQI